MAMQRESKTASPPASALWGVPHGDPERKAEICTQILAEARRLVRNGQFGSSLNQLVFRAGELLDDLDEVLRVPHPAPRGRDAAPAEALHRELAQIRAAIAERSMAPARLPHADDDDR
jgi:hypothetical protein